MAAVKDLVIDAMRNTVSASGTRSSPSRIVPDPPAWTSSPSRITPQAMPGMRFSSRRRAKRSSMERRASSNVGIAP